MNQTQLIIYAVFGSLAIFGGGVVAYYTTDFFWQKFLGFLADKVSDRIVADVVVSTQAQTKPPETSVKLPVTSVKLPVPGYCKHRHKSCKSLGRTKAGHEMHMETCMDCDMTRMVTYGEWENI